MTVKMTADAASIYMLGKPPIFFRLDLRASFRRRAFKQPLRLSSAGQAIPMIANDVLVMTGSGAGGVRHQFETKTKTVVMPIFFAAKPGQSSDALDLEKNGTKSVHGRKERSSLF